MPRYLEISKSNSIDFYKLSLSTVKNDLNSSTCEGFNNFNYNQYQNYRKGTVITEQLRSGYTTVEAFLVDSNGAETSLTITKKTTDMGKKLSYDGWKYNYKSSGQLAIYYTAGNIYDYGTSTVDSTFTLNGNLPEYAIVGQTVQHYLGLTYNIIGVVYDEDIDSMVILTDGSYTGVPTELIFQSEYDLNPYEVYEFDVDFSINGLYTLKTRNLAFDEITQVHLTDKINIQDDFSKFVDVVYYDTDNQDIMYSTGIHHKILVPYDKIVAGFESDSEYISTDNSARLIDSTIDDKNTFFISEVNTSRMRQINIALSAKIVIINNEGYISEGSISPTNIENTNLYNIEAPMLKTNIDYEEESYSQLFLIEDGEGNVITDGQENQLITY